MSPPYILVMRLMMQGGCKIYPGCILVKRNIRFSVANDKFIISGRSVILVPYIDCIYDEAEFIQYGGDLLASFRVMVSEQVWVIFVQEERLDKVN